MGHACQMLLYADNTPPVSPQRVPRPSQALAVTPNTEKAARTLASFRDLPSIPAPATAAQAHRNFAATLEEEADRESRKRRSSSAPL